MSSRLVVASTFFNAWVNFSTAYSKRSMVSTRGDPCTRGLFGGVCKGLPGGVSGGRGEVGGIGTTTSVGAMVLVLEQCQRTKMFQVSAMAV